MPTFDDLLARARAAGIPDDDLPRTAPEDGRLVELAGNSNFRDLGGYAAANGTTNWRVLYRSDRLNELTDADLATLEGLGLRRVHDFRLESERIRQPSRVPAGVDVQILPTGDIGIDHTMVDRILDMLAGRTPLPEPTFWAENYRDLVDNGRPMFCLLIDELGAADERLPAVFHCTAGKDRTGVAAALVLDLAGVDRDVIVDDYLLTNLYRTPVRIEGMRRQLDRAGISVADAMPALSAGRACITRMFEIVDDEYGGSRSYLETGGTHPDNIDRLLERFVGARRQ